VPESNDGEHPPAVAALLASSPDKGVISASAILAAHRGHKGEDITQVREHSSAVERCGPHVASSPIMLRSSDEKM